ncbi:carboxymuconolactone decarboxylase family protein [Haloferax larsenii]|uniref:Alkylhydroperoxidase AhpD family core domain-containing protein n=1 Tax=Haloferax larsenii TaxID=302484 RepID=A0A1H7IQI3_HALLR|nr:carboxymuconolactone decarboxylase family protein [Haloferax larsenii]SEK64743.1 alkylhydroperoxidase AhpD family core domain-containing protein [Haloferax larsenii]
MATTAGRGDVGAVRADIEETLGFVPGFWELNDADLVNEWPNFKRHAFEETAIPPKYKELIGLAIAANIKCPYCQRFHKSAAKMHGATEEELNEVAFLASWTARYSAIIHGMDYDMDTFEDEFERMAEHLEEQLADDD